MMLAGIVLGGAGASALSRLLVALLYGVTIEPLEALRED